MIRVGFVINFGHQKWLGGFNIIINLIKALYLLPNRKIEPILIINKKFKIKKINEVKNIKYIKSDLFFNQSLLNRFYNKFLIKFYGKSIIYDKFFNSHRINVLSHTLLPLGKNSSVKSLPWIPDFQYIYYPKFFSFKNRIMKNINVNYTPQMENEIRDNSPMFYPLQVLPLQLPVLLVHLHRLLLHLSTPCEPFHRFQAPCSYPLIQSAQDKSRPLR